MHRSGRIVSRGPGALQLCGHKSSVHGEPNSTENESKKRAGRDTRIVGHNS